MRTALLSLTTLFISAPLLALDCTQTPVHEHDALAENIQPVVERARDGQWPRTCVVNDEVLRRRALAETLVETYQARIQEKYSQRVEIVYQSDACTSTGMAIGFYKGTGPLQLTIGHGSLTLTSAPAMLTAVCHEIGHLFGEITPRSFGVDNGPSSDFAVDGDADYFSAHCSREFFRQQNITVDPLLAAREMIQSIHPGQSFSEAEARGQSFSGIDLHHPEASCRLLTFGAGLRNEPRPSCWYNP